MSKMSELSIDIEEMHNQGYEPLTISQVLNIPIAWVYSVLYGDYSVDSEEKFS